MAYAITSKKIGRKSTVYTTSQGHGHGWTQLKSEARRFETREAAEAEIARSLSLTKGSAFFEPAQVTAL